MLDWIVNGVIIALSFGFVLGLLVFIHELGHYAMGRFFGVAVQRFSIGFGKPIVRYKAKSGTQWVVSRIPLGGYVKFLGDGGAASNPDTDELEKIKAKMDEEHGKDVWKSVLHFKPLYQRALVALAGPVANFILAAVLYAGLAIGFGRNVNTPIVGVVDAGTPAAQAGLMVGDKILAINKSKTRYSDDVRQIITLNTGEDLVFTVDRAGKDVDLVIVPVRVTRTDGVGGKYTGGQAGFRFAYNYVHKKYSIGEAALYGPKAVGTSIANMGKYIGRIFRGKEDGKQLGSVVKIGAIAGKLGVMSAKTEGGVGNKLKALTYNLLNFAAALSVGLGVANLMPIPVLDGGHLLYYGYEAVMRRPLSARAQEIGFRVGFAVLITLFFVLTWNDIGYIPDLFTKSG